MIPSITVQDKYNLFDVKSLAMRLIRAGFSINRIEEYATSNTMAAHRQGNCKLKFIQKEDRWIVLFYENLD